MIFRPSLTKSFLLLNKTKYCKIPCTDIFSPQVNAVFFASLPTIFLDHVSDNFSYFLFMGLVIKCISNEVQFTSVVGRLDSV